MPTVRFAVRAGLVAALFSTFLLAGEARADLELGGHVKSFVFQELGSPWEIDRAGSRLQLSARGGSDRVRYFAAIDFELDSRLLTSDQPVSRGEGLDTYPVEMYLEILQGPVEIRLGQQFIFWGRTTWVNPTDVLSPWNYPDMASEIEDYRLAPFGARANWYLRNELMLDAVWLPLFRPNRLGSMEITDMGGLPVVEEEPLMPDPTLENGEFGLRLSDSISSLAFDWAVCAYKGFEKYPSMIFEPHIPEGAMPPAPDSIIFRRRYDPLWMVGLDFARAFGPIVLKGESGFKLTDDRDGTDPTIQNSRVESVLGIDYVLSQDLEFGVQYVSDMLLDYDQDAETAALTEAMMGQTPSFVAAGVTHEVSLRANVKLTSYLGAQVIGLYNVTYNDFFAIGFLSWDIADALKAYAGGVGFGGAGSSTPYARQKDYSRLFVEVKYSF